MKTCVQVLSACPPVSLHVWVSVLQPPIYTQCCKYNTQKVGCCGAAGEFAGGHGLLDVWVLSGAGLKVSNSSLRILKFVSPAAPEVWQHFQMSLLVRKIFFISHPLEWRLPIKCLFSAV